MYFNFFLGFTGSVRHWNYFSLNAFSAFLTSALLYNFCQHNWHRLLCARLWGWRGISTSAIFCFPNGSGVNLSTVSFNSCTGMHAILSDWRGAILKNHRSYMESKYWLQSKYWLSLLNQWEAKDVLLRKRNICWNWKSHQDKMRQVAATWVLTQASWGDCPHTSVTVSIVISHSPEVPLFCRGFSYEAVRIYFYIKGTMVVLAKNANTLRTA